ncbi:M48 family metallopeptidase [Spongisporangium articulatum]|uniref:M48 family metallopeptidase n=1 Tax=Spongisporangium articulatum TaxID=3362603 RepID=A0ABW8ALW9_9ACTN
MTSSATASVSTRPPRRSRRGDRLLLVVMLVLAHPLVTVVALAGAVTVVATHLWFVLLPVAGLVGLKVVGNVFVPDDPPGRPVEAPDEPELVDLVRKVAERLDVHEALTVRIAPDANASMIVTRQGRRRVKTVLIGWPLIRCFSPEQLVATLAHEMAHAPELGDRLWLRLAVTRETLVEKQGRLLAPPAFVVRPLLRATQKRLWEAEFDADARAAQLAGSEALREAMRRTEGLVDVWDLLVEDWVDYLADDDEYPIDLYAAYAAAAGDPHVLARARLRSGAPDPEPLADTHPDWAQRAQALPEPLEPVRPDDVRRLVGPVPARGAVEIRAWEVIEQWCADQVASAEKDEDWHPVSLFDRPATAFTPPADAYRDGLRDGTGSDDLRDGLRRSLTMIADGDAWALACAVDAELNTLPAELGRWVASRLLATVLGGALDVVLREAGWRPATHWLTGVLLPPAADRGATEAAEEADDVPLDLQALVVEAVETREVSRLRALLERA